MNITIPTQTETTLETTLSDLSVSYVEPTSEHTSISLTDVSTESGPVLIFIGRVICTAKDSVNIRQKAGTESPVIGTLPSGKTADVIEYYDNWAYISYNDLTGYVSREYIINWSMPEIAVPAGDWASILVNPSHFLPDGFKASMVDFEGGQVDSRILDICVQMFSDAEEDGVSLMLVDAYRSYDRQNELYNEKVDSYISKGYNREDAEIKAATITARPDTSEHQTGLALDIVTLSYKIRDKGFENTEAYKWLDANAQNYGFTLRYKQDKEEFTKVIYEPWHWRFVGIKASEDMKASGECLEEYLGMTD